MNRKLMIESKDTKFQLGIQCRIHQTILKYQTKTRPLAGACPLPPGDPSSSWDTAFPSHLLQPLCISQQYSEELYLETHWPWRPGNQAGGLHSPSCPQLQIPGIIPSPVAKHFQGPVLPL